VQNRATDLHKLRHDYISEIGERLYYLVDLLPKNAEVQDDETALIPLQRPSYDPFRESDDLARCLMILGCSSVLQGDESVHIKSTLLVVFSGDRYDRNEARSLCSSAALGLLCPVFTSNFPHIDQT